MSINEDATELIEEGNNSIKSKEFECAIEAFDSMLQVDPSNEKAFVGKIESLRKLRRFSEAEKLGRELS